jgi:hypothetical protein
MSSNSESQGAGDSTRRVAAEAVRQAFAALPAGDKLSTLLRVELDMLGDFADVMVSTAEKVADEIVAVFTCSEGSAAS